MAKKNDDSQEFIKIPRDFKSLHDLKDLLREHKFLRRLLSALKDYKKAYVEDHLMTISGVLAYIPPTKLDEYQLHCRGRSFLYSKEDQSLPFERRLEIFLRRVNHLPDTKEGGGVDAFRKFLDGKAICLVDTHKKIVEFCGWASETVKKGIGNDKKDVPLFAWDTGHDFKYGRKEYSIDEKSEILTLEVSYDFVTYERVGGFRRHCSTGHSYSSGGKMEEVMKWGTDRYKFCLRTNNYLGYAAGIEY